MDIENGYSNWIMVLVKEWIVTLDLNLDIWLMDLEKMGFGKKKGIGFNKNQEKGPMAKKGERKFHKLN